MSRQYLENPSVLLLFCPSVGSFISALLMLLVPVAQANAPSPVPNMSWPCRIQPAILVS